jgi:hypothetical protein
MELEVQWQEHELGEYPMIVLTWEDGMRGAPWGIHRKVRGRPSLSMKIAEKRSPEPFFFLKSRGQNQNEVQSACSASPFHRLIESGAGRSRDIGVIRAGHDPARRRTFPDSVLGLGCGKFLLGAKAGVISNATSAKARMRQISAPSKRDERAGWTTINDRRTFSGGSLAG